MKNILIVDDEPDILQLLAYNLELANYSTKTFENGEDAIIYAREILPDLILLDLMLPGINGLKVCELLKKDKTTSKIPIIMLTAKGEENDIVKGLDIGADDYITKPFSPKVLIARIDAVLRRLNFNQLDKESEVIKFKNLSIHLGKREVNLDDKKIVLTFSEFQILTLLINRPGWVFTRNMIIDALHGENYPVTDRSVDFQIVGLRKKLLHYGNYIKTVRSVGYRFLDND
tara:strand:- start:45236 stop:45925 length:690 start_codon:yes stop_codon:yes gene_type:complete